MKAGGWLTVLRQHQTAGQGFLSCGTWGFKEGPIHSIKPPSRRGKWNLAWPLNLKTKQNS